MLPTVAHIKFSVLSTQITFFIKILNIRLTPPITFCNQSTTNTDYGIILSKGGDLLK